tara:strand:- start:1114 stop:1566 length:453 start_codon:yes stop_codon:yes gene_type:complete
MNDIDRGFERRSAKNRHHRQNLDHTQGEVFDHKVRRGRALDCNILQDTFPACCKILRVHVERCKTRFGHIVCDARSAVVCVFLEQILADLVQYLRSVRHYDPMMLPASAVVVAPALAAVVVAPALVVAPASAAVQRAYQNSRPQLLAPMD